MKKKIISALLVLSMAAGYLFSVPAFAADPTYSGGSGSKDDPFLISTAEDMWTLAAHVNSQKMYAQAYNGKWFKVTEDIDLGCSESKPWYPIADWNGKGMKFCGTFDGDGHTISGLYTAYIKSGSGLFGCLGNWSGERIKNLNVKGFVQGYYDVGGITGRTYGGAGLTNCTFEGEVKGTQWVGGLVGDGSDDTYISGCTVDGKVSGSGSVGGIVGKTYLLRHLSNCTNNAQVTGSSGNVGGMIGELWPRPSVTITGCINNGVIKGGGNVGGMVGYGTQGGSVSNCYNTGDITGSSVVGGIYGLSAPNIGIRKCYNTGRITAEYHSGGIVGKMIDGTYIENSYNLGNVTATENAGGIAGIYNMSQLGTRGNTKMVNVYNIGTVTAVISPGGLLGKNGSETERKTSDIVTSTACYLDTACQEECAGTKLTAEQLADESSFSGWSGFSNDWSMSEGAGRPILNDLNEGVMISTANDFLELYEDVKRGNKYSNVYIYLENDIDLDGIDWFPIGSYDIDEESIMPFCGNFNGNGYTISNLNCDAGSEEYQGLFGYVGENGHIKNVILDESCFFSAGEHTGAIAAFNAGTIENCENYAEVIGGEYTGGIVGENSKGGLVTKCYNAGPISSTESEVGGIAGYNIEATISECANEGSVDADVSFAGGIVGQNHTGTVTNCYSSGEVRAIRAYSGGVVGQTIGSGAKVSNCYSYGRVYSYEICGGVAGSNTNSSVIENCYYLEDMADGGISGEDSPKSAQDVSDSAQKLTEAQFANQSSFSGWNFNDIWTLAGGRPLFKWTMSLNGKGTEDDPYLIKNANDLYKMSLLMETSPADRNKHFLMTNDIDLDGVDFRPIGINRSAPFSGVFDGGGHTVTGFNIPENYQSADYYGFFGVATSGTVKNLNVEGDMNITSNNASYVGGIVGYMQYATIENCSYTGNIYVNKSGSARIGGISGYSYYDNIKNCSFEGTIRTNTANTGAYLGGILGTAEGCTIQRCSSNGSIEGGANPGGIVGTAYAPNVNCYNCYSTGSVKSYSKYGYASGILGDYNNLFGSFKIDSCYSTATLSAKYMYALALYGSNLEFINSYYLRGIGKGYSGATEKTEDQFASGEVAYLLQNGQSEQVWGQTLAGFEADDSPVLTKDTNKAVHKITCATKSNSNYAAGYGTAEGVGFIPSLSKSDGFIGWSLTNSANGKMLTEDTPITSDITVYAVSQEMYGEADSDKTVRIDYGKGGSVDLSEYIVYQKGTDTKGKYTYTIDSGNSSLKATVSGDTLTIPTFAPVGTYNLSVTATEKTPNISLMSVSFDNLPVTMDITVIVGKRDATVTAPKAKSLTYNGSEQELVTAGTTTGGTLMYSLDDKTYSTDIPKGTNAGNYTVYYKLDGGEEFNDINAKSVNTTIAKAEGVVTDPVLEPVVYGAKLSDIPLPEGWRWWYSSTVPTVKNSGYRAIYTITDFTNYNWSGVPGYMGFTGWVDRTLKVTVVKADPVVTPPAGKSLKTTGEMQELIYAGKTTGGTLVYSLDGKTYSADIPKAREKGNYTVYYKVIGDDNYNDTAPQTITAELGKSDIPEDKITYPKAVKDLEYNKKEQELVTAGTAIEGTKFLYSLDNKTYSEEIPTAVNAGTYVVYYKVDGGELYNDIPVRGLNVAIAKQNPAGDVIIKAFDLYDKITEQNPVYGVKLSDIELTEYFEWIDGSIVPEVDYAYDNGYPAKMYIEDDENYDWDGVEGYDSENKIWWIDLPFEMDKADITSVTAPTARELTYIGYPQELVTRGSAEGGRLLYSLDGETYSDTVPTGRNAGEYTVYYKAVGDSNHNDTEAKTVKVNIAKRPVDFTPPSNPQAVVYGKKLSEIGLTGGWSWVDGNIVPTVNNNGYKAKKSVSYDANYDWEKVEGFDAKTNTVTRTVAVKVNKAKSDVAVPANLSATYGDTLSKIELPSGWTWYKPEQSVGNAGTGFFTVVYTPDDTDNYEVLYKNIYVEVKKATPVVTAPEAKDITYTGLAQELVTAAGTTGGTLLYSIDGDNYFTSVPKGRNAGEYTVYYMVEGDGNYNDVDEQSINVTVKKATPNLTVQMPSWTLGGDTPEPVISGNVSGGTVTYEYKAKDANDSTYTASKPNTDGEFTVRATVSATDNYMSAAATADFTVSEPEGVPIANTLTYNGNEQALVASDNDKFVYSLDGTNFTSSIPKATEAGTYTVYYKIGTSIAKTVEVTILPAAAKLDTPNLTQVEDYGAKLSNYTLPEGWSWKDGNTVPQVAERAGYEAEYTVSDSKNYNWTDVEGYDAATNKVTRYITVKVNKIAPMYTAPTAKTLTYNGKAQELVTNGSTNDGTIFYMNNSLFYHLDLPTTKITTGVDAGEYTVKYQVIGDRNHSNIDNQEIKVTITPAKAELTEPTLTSVAYGKRLSDISLPTGWSWANGDTVPTVNNSGYNAIYDTTQGTLDSNHTWEGVDGYNSETKEITRTLSLMVNKAIPTEEVPTELTANYGDTLSKVNLPTGWRWEDSSQSVGDAGEHSFRAIYNPDSDNYNDLNTTVSVTVNKVAPEVTAPTANNDLIYTGLAQELVQSGETTGGTLLYSTNGTDYSTVIPQGVDAGNYAVYYKVEEDGNYNGTEPQEIPVTIQKSEFDITVSMAEWVLGSEEGPQPVVSGNISGGEITFEYKRKDAGEEAYSASQPNTDEEYTVRATVAATQNYESTSATADFMVSQPSDKPVARNLIYNGTELELISGGDSSYEYSLDGENYSNDIPKATDAGDYTVYYKVADTTVNELNVKIYPQPQTIATPSISDTVTYGIPLSQVTLPAGWDWEDGTIVPEVNNSGYKVVYTISYDPNYDWSAAEGYSRYGDTITITRLIKVNVAKAEPNVIPPTPKTLTYNGKSQQLVTAGGGDGVMFYGLKSGLWEVIPSTNTRNIPTGVDAKTYTVYYQVWGDRNHLTSDVKSVDVTILPKAATLETPQAETVVYGKALSEIPLPEGWEWKNGETIPTVTNSGYDAEYTVTPNSNYTWADVAGYDSSTRKVTRTIPVTVTKAASTPKIPTELTAAYGQKLSDITLPNGWAWSNAGESVGDAGTHTFEAVYKPEDTDNYSLYNADLTVEVNKATPTVTVPTARELTYDGSAQELVTAATTTGGTLLYSLDGENYFTTVPKARNAGDYTVYYKVEDDANYNGIEAAIVDVNVAKAAITPNVSMPEWTLGGAAPEPVLTGNIGGGEVTYEYKLKTADDSEYSETKPVDAGNYTIRATIAATTNYEGKAVTADFTVYKAAGAPVVRYLTYNGEPQSLVTAENDGFVYSLDGETYTQEIPTATNAGTYTIYYKIGNSSAETLEVTISPAIPEFAEPEIPESVVYGKHLYEIPLSDRWMWENGDIVPDVNNAGYEVVYYIRADEEDESYKNFAWSNVEGFDEENLTITRMISVNITKADMSATLPRVKMRTYNGAEQELVTAGSAQGGQMLYSLNGTDYTTNVPTGIDAKTYTVYYKAVGDANHNNGASGNLTVTIFPKDAELAEPTLSSVTYGTKLSEIPLPEGWEWTDETITPTVTNSGYEAKYTVTTDPNYSWARVEGYDSETGMVTRILPLTVNKANSAPEIPTSLTATYGDTLSGVELPQGWGWQDSEISVGNAGTHTFTAVYTPLDLENYETLESDVTITVSKTQSAVTEPEPKTLVYTGTNQELITAPEVTGGTVLYSLDGEKYSTAVPSGKDAGEYTVYYKVKGDENHLDTEPETVTASIEKADIPLDILMLSWYEGEESSEPIIYGNTGQSDITYEYKPQNSDDSEYSKTMPEAHGVYKIKATAEETKNYNGATATSYFTILPSESGEEYALMFIDDFLYITAPYGGPCTVIFAAYKNGILQNVSCEEKVFSDAGADIAVMPEKMKAGEPDEIRAMLWNNMSDMMPLCKTELWSGLN